MGRTRFTVLISDRSRRSLVTMATAAFLVVPSIGVGLLVTGSPAQAAPAMTFTPKGPFKGGEIVQVSFSGYAAGAPVAIGVCPQGRNVTGPGDCGRTKSGNSRLVTADASGKGTGKIKIPIGPLNNLKAPKENCGPAKTDGCTMGASAIDGSGQAPLVTIRYAAVAATPKPSATPKPTTSATPTAEPTDDVSPQPKPPVGNDDLADTGPSSTGWMALVGFGALQIGLIAAVRAARAAPARHLA